jgi:cobalt-zinc-cadmium efflux system protein
MKNGSKRCLCNASWLHWSLCLGILVVIIEVVGGLYSGSLALLADASHTAIDVLFYGFAIYIQRRLYARPWEDEHRWEHRASISNGLLFFGAAAIIAGEAFSRGGEAPVDAKVMGWVALASVVLNLSQNLVLRFAAKNLTNTQVAKHNTVDAAQGGLVWLAALLGQWGVAVPGLADGLAAGVIALCLVLLGHQALTHGHNH